MYMWFCLHNDDEDNEVDPEVIGGIVGTGGRT